MVFSLLSMYSFASESENQKQIYTYLRNTMKLNVAAACGVLANIEYESSFNPKLEGDKVDGKYTSYGICQWHASRKTALINYCKENGYNYKELEGQLHYLEYELKNDYPKVYNYLKNVDNMAQGAYDAGYYWCYNFEIPSDKATKAKQRGNVAKNDYWPDYYEQELNSSSLKPPTTVKSDKSVYDFGDSITITWSGAKNADHYGVQLNKNGTKQFSATNITAKSYKIGELANGSYEFYVWSINASGKASLSNYCSFKMDHHHTYSTKVTKPTVNGTGYTKYTCTVCGDTYKSDYTVAPPTVTAGNNYETGKVKLTWGTVTGAKKYYVYRSTSKDSGYKYLGTSNGNTYTNGSAVAGTKYYYKVKSVMDDGTKSVYSQVVARTCDCARPVVTAGNVASSGKVKLTWTSVEGAEKYVVYRRTGSSGDYTEIGTTSKTSYTDKNSKTGTKYYYRVKAVCSNTSANSAKSLSVARTCDCARPEVSIKLATGGYPKMSWTAIDKATSYTVYRATSKSGSYTKLTTTSKTSYTDKNAVEGKTYYYKVKAICDNTSANSAYSTVVSIKAK